MADEVGGVLDRALRRIKRLPRGWDGVPERDGLAWGEAERLVSLARSRVDAERIAEYFEVPLRG